MKLTRDVLVVCAALVAGLAMTPPKAYAQDAEAKKRILVIPTNTNLMPQISFGQRKELAEVFQNWLTQQLQQKGMATPELDTQVLGQLQKLQELGETGVTEYAKSGKLSGVDFVLLTRISEVRNVNKIIESGVRCQIEGKLVDVKTADSKAVTGAAEHFGSFFHVDNINKNVNYNVISTNKATEAAYKALMDMTDRMFPFETNVVLIERSNRAIIQRGSEVGLKKNQVVFIFKPATVETVEGVAIKRAAKFVCDGKIVEVDMGTAEILLGRGGDQVQKGYVVRTRKD